MSLAVYEAMISKSIANREKATVAHCYPYNRTRQSNKTRSQDARCCWTTSKPVSVSCATTYALCSLPSGWELSVKENANTTTTRGAKNRLLERIRKLATPAHYSCPSDSRPPSLDAVCGGPTQMISTSCPRLSAQRALTPNCLLRSQNKDACPI